MNIAAALLSWRISPLSRINQVDLVQIRDVCIKVFLQKGMPHKIRVDNGDPFGSPKQKVVPVIALWLIGFGIKLIWNPPRSPKKNPKVERGQRTSKSWADIYNCESYEQLQRNLDKTCKFQSTQFKVRRLGHKTRSEVFPNLVKKARPFRVQDFDIQKVYKYLEQCSFSRRISKAGQISIYKQRYYIDQSKKYQPVHLNFLSQSLQWRITDDNGKLIKIVDAPNLSEQRVWNLTVCQRT